MTQTPTDALRLVNPHKDIIENLRQAAVDLHPWFVGDAETFSVDCALPAYLNDAADEIERLRAAAPVSPESDLLKEAVGLLREMREQARVGYGGAPVMRSKRINLPATLWHRSNTFLSKVEERG